MLFKLFLWNQVDANYDHFRKDHVITPLQYAPLFGPGVALQCESSNKMNAFMFGYCFKI